MSLPTCAVSAYLFKQDGQPDVGAVITARLKGFEIDSGDGYVIPSEVSATTDVNGHAVLNLWPNEVGSVESSYSITIEGSEGQVLRTTAVVPNQANANLEAIAVLPPYPGKVDGQIAVEEAIAAAGTSQTNATNAAASAAAAATSETNAAGSETNAAASETAAQQSANDAADSAATALTYKQNALQSASDAAAAQIAAQSARDDAQAAQAAAEAAETAAAASAAAADASKTATEALYGDATALSNAVSDAQAARDAAQAAQTAAETARAGAEVAQAAAETAQTAAETAKAAAETAQAAAEAAEANAATSESSASTSAAAASASASAASTSQAAAAGSATSAGSSASAASASATAADTSRVAAQAAQTAAETARTGAQTAQTAAETAKTAAEAARDASQAARDAALAAQAEAESALVGATTKASEAAASAAAASATVSSAQALYGGAAALDGAVNEAEGFALTATAQAALATTMAAAASSVAQQDLSGAQAKALHRSPNPVVAQCIDDPRTWTDGGAVLKRLAGLSYQTETLNGTWLGRHSSEMGARDYFGSLGADSIVTGDSSTFDKSVGAWAVSGTSATISAVGGRLRVVATGANPNVYLAIPTVAGQRYRVQTNLKSITSGRIAYVNVGTSAIASDLAAGPNTPLLDDFGVSFVATGATSYVRLTGAANYVAGDTFEFGELTVKPVDLSKNPSGAYYGDSTTGKFYRLWRNLLPSTEDLTTNGWSKTNTGTASLPVLVNVAGAGPNGENATQITMNKGAGTTTTDFCQVFPTGNLSPVAQGTSYGFGYMVKAATAGDVGKIIGYRGAAGIGYTTVTLTNLWQFISSEEVAGSNFAIPSFALRGGIGCSDSASFQVTRVQFVVGPALDATYESKTTNNQGQSETLVGNKAAYGRTAWIAEAARVPGYATDEPGCPLWKVLTAGANNAVRGTTISSVQAGNGWLLVGTNSGLTLIDFAKDCAINWGAGGRSRYLGSLAQCNDGKGWAVEDASKTIASNTVNAVAVTVMPDAPCDPVTRLQVPTVQVLTAGGMSVIQNNGTVVNSAITSTFVCGSITPKGLMAAANNNVYWAANPNTLGASFAMTNIAASLPGFAFSSPTSPSGVMQPRREWLVKRAASGAKVSRILLNESNPAASLQGDITDTYNTGWSVAAMRQYLADTAVGVVSDANLAPNGNFPTDTAGWSSAQGTLSWVSANRVRLESSGTGSSVRAYFSFATVPGKTYAAKCAVYSCNATAAITANLSGVASPPAISDETFITAGNSGTASKKFVATGATTTVLVYSGTVAGNFAEFGSVELSEVVADRSYKGAALLVHGTVTRTKVGGVSVIGGFSNTNYLQESAASTDLDPGTGAVHETVWGSVPATPDPSKFPALSGNLAPGGGTFDDATGWNLGVGWSVAGGKASHAAGTSSPITGTVGAAGKFYRVTWTVSGATSGQSYAVGGSSVSSTQAGNGTFVAIVKSNAATVGAGGTGTFDGSIDDLLIEEVGPAIAVDRSAATGAFYREGCWPDGTLVAQVGDGTTTRTVTSPASYLGQRVKFGFAYDTSGTLTLNVNGQPVASAPGTPLASLSNAAAVFTVGNVRDGTAPWPGDLALLDIGMTIPTAEQSALEYAQEAAMFQSGAVCVLPDAGSVVDMDYDAEEGKWKVVSAANESTFNGLVRTASAPVSAGSIAKVTHKSGIKLIARTGTNAGVDITIPPQNLVEALNRRNEDASRHVERTFVWPTLCGFQANTTAGSGVLSNVTNFTSPPMGATVVGAKVKDLSGNDYTVTSVDSSGKPLTVTPPVPNNNTNMIFSFYDYILPVGWEIASVYRAGLMKEEGTTKDYTKQFDGFRERVRFATGVSNGDFIAIDARKVA